VKRKNRAFDLDRKKNNRYIYSIKGDLSEPQPKGWVPAEEFSLQADKQRRKRK